MWNISSGHGNQSQQTYPLSLLFPPLLIPAHFLVAPAMSLYLEIFSLGEVDSWDKQDSYPLERCLDQRENCLG